MADDDASSTSSRAPGDNDTKPKHLSVREMSIRQLWNALKHLRDILDNGDYETVLGSLDEAKRMVLVVKKELITRGVSPDIVEWDSALLEGDEPEIDVTGSHFDITATTHGASVTGPATTAATAAATNNATITGTANQSTAKTKKRKASAFDTQEQSAVSKPKEEQAKNKKVKTHTVTKNTGAVTKQNKAAVHNAWNPNTVLKYTDAMLSELDAIGKRFEEFDVIMEKFMDEYHKIRIEITKSITKVHTYIDATRTLLGDDHEN